MSPQQGAARHSGYDLSANSGSTTPSSQVPITTWRLPRQLRLWDLARRNLAKKNKELEKPTKSPTPPSAANPTKGFAPPSAAKDVVRLELTSIEKCDVNLLPEGLEFVNKFEEWKARGASDATKLDHFKHDENNSSFKQKRQVSEGNTPPCISVFSIDDHTKDPYAKDKIDGYNKGLLARQHSENMNNQKSKLSTILRATNSYPCESKDSATSEIHASKPKINHKRETERKANQVSHRRRGDKAPDHFKPLLTNISKPLHIVTKLRNGNEASEAPKLQFLSHLDDKQLTETSSLYFNGFPSESRNYLLRTTNDQGSLRSPVAKGKASLDLPPPPRANISSDCGPSESSAPTAALPHFWSRRKKLRNAPCPALEYWDVLREAPRALLSSIETHLES